MDIRDRRLHREVSPNFYDHCMLRFSMLPNEVDRYLRAAGGPQPPEAPQSLAPREEPRSPACEAASGATNPPTERPDLADAAERIRARAALPPWYLRKSDPDPAAEDEAGWLARQGLSVSEGIKMLRRFFAVCDARGYPPAESVRTGFGSCLSSATLIPLVIMGRPA